MRNAHHLHMKETKSQSTAPRARQAHNLYLDSDLLKRAKATLDLPGSRHKSVSGLIEDLLAKHLSRVGAKAA